MQTEPFYNQYIQSFNHYTLPYPKVLPALTNSF